MFQLVKPIITTHYLHTVAIVTIVIGVYIMVLSWQTNVYISLYNLTKVKLHYVLMYIVSDILLLKWVLLQKWCRANISQYVYICVDNEKQNLKLLNALSNTT